MADHSCVYFVCVAAGCHCFPLLPLRESRLCVCVCASGWVYLIRLYKKCLSLHIHSLENVIIGWP